MARTVSDGNSADPQGENETDLFVPVKRGKTTTAKKAQIEDSVKDLLGKVEESLKADPTDKLLRYFERENERARQHEMKLFAMLFGNQPYQPPAPSPPSMEFQGNGFQQPQSSTFQWQNGAQNWNMQGGNPYSLQNLERPEKQQENNNVYEQLF